MKQDKNDRLDPDVRFLLANERTLLAWIRTSIGMEAGGVALTQLHHTAGHGIFGILIVLFGGALSLVGYHRYLIADRSIRNHHLPPRGSGPTVQVVAVVAVAMVLAIAALASM